MTRFQFEANLRLQKLGYHTVNMYPGAEYGTVPIPGWLVMYFPKEDKHVLINGDGSTSVIDFSRFVNAV